MKQVGWPEVDGLGPPASMSTSRNMPVNLTSLSRARRGLTAAVAGGALVAGVLAAQPPAQAAAPGNDNFANATAISGTSITLTDSNTAATTEAGEPTNMGYQWATGATVWYRWTAPATAEYAITTAGSSFDTELGVYTGSSVGALTRVVSNDDDMTNDSTSGVGFAATAGTTYSIQVGGYYDPEAATQAAGTITLALGQAAVTGSMVYLSDDPATSNPLAGCLGFFTDPSDPVGTLVASNCGIGTPDATSAYAAGLLPAGTYYVAAAHGGNNTWIYYPGGGTDSANATAITIPAGGCTLTGLNVNFNTNTFSAPTGKSCPLAPACLSAKAAVGSASAALASGKATLAKDKHALAKAKKKLKKAKKHHQSTKKLAKKLKKAKKNAKATTKKVNAAATGVAAAQQRVTASC